MTMFDTLYRKLPVLLVAALLSACGGGGGGSSSTPSTPTTPVTPPQTSTCVTSTPGVPVATGDTAKDGFNWFNYRRAAIGLTMLSCNQMLMTAAAGHSNYLMLNNVVSHDQVSGNPGFTGLHVSDRMAAAGYILNAPYAYGEVISAVSDRSGSTHAEELIAAIYHRFIIFEPKFKEMGSGAATRSDGYTYFTTDMAATNGLAAGLGLGKIVVYPYDGQTSIPTSFDSDTESPDPVPNQNTVGYPVSVHADITATITVTSFTIKPHSGLQMSTRVVSNTDEDPAGRLHAVAIVPLAVLSPGTTYDVSFSGTVDGTAVTKNWSFTTK